MMRLLFAGTPEFAAAALAALLDAGHDVPLVLTQPDRPAGRGQKLAQSAVKQLALAHGIPVQQPPTLKTPEALDILRKQGAATMVVAAYGLILPPAVLDLFPQGCINIHASLLPRWRGAAPIQRALMAGDTRTGVCIMRMDAGLDTGPVMLREALDIAPRETGGSLHDRLALMGAALIVRALAGIEQGNLQLTHQPDEGVTYAHKITKDEARIDWRLGVREIDARIRAFNPAPVCFTSYAGAPLRIWEAYPLDAQQTGDSPGTVLAASAQGIDVACADGLLRLTMLQRAGGTRQQVADFLRGQPLSKGAVLA
jgi:methionyl-tRNA formyltransferase